MIAQSSSRRRPAVAATAAGLFSLVLGGSVLAAAPAVAADPPGNNGTVKVEGVDLRSGPPDNNPHQGCSFTIEFYNYDENSAYSAKVTFADQAPTADGGLQVVSGDLTPFIGEDPAGGGNDLDAKVTYRLNFTGQPQPQQGYHVKLTVEAEGSIGADTKRKVFWVEGCTTVTPSTTPPTKRPTRPKTTPRTTRSTVAVPETSGPTGTTSVPAPSVPRSTGVPTEVDAGLAGNATSAEDSSGRMNALGGILLTGGGLILASGAALVLRRRGRHSL